MPKLIRGHHSTKKKNKIKYSEKGEWKFSQRKQKDVNSSRDRMKYVKPSVLENRLPI